MFSFLSSELVWVDINDNQRAERGVGNYIMGVGNRMCLTSYFWLTSIYKYLFRLGNKNLSK